MNEMIMKKLRNSCLKISHLGNDGNLQSVFSSLDIMWVLFDSVMNVEPETAANRDRFVLSKGQSSLGLYAILVEKRILSPEEVETFCKFDSRFGMQIDRTKFTEAGIEISAGSLGHGFPMAAGMSMAMKIQKSTGRVFSLVGDGEFNEGTMWEAALLASARQLDNLCVIIDDNDSIGKMLDMGDLQKKLDSFGFVVRVVNGHDHSEIKAALIEFPTGKPLAVIAKTQRGYGSRTMMQDAKWFHRAPDAGELAMLIEEVENFAEAGI